MAGSIEILAYGIHGRNCNKDSIGRMGVSLEHVRNHEKRNKPGSLGIANWFGKSPLSKQFRLGVILVPEVEHLALEDDDLLSVVVCLEDASVLRTKAGEQEDLSSRSVGGLE